MLSCFTAPPAPLKAVCSCRTVSCHLRGLALRAQHLRSWREWLQQIIAWWVWGKRQQSFPDKSQFGSPASSLWVPGWGRVWKAGEISLWGWEKPMGLGWRQKGRRACYFWLRNHHLFCNLVNKITSQEQRATFMINSEHFISLRPAQSYSGDTFLIKHCVMWGIKSVINWEIGTCNLISFKDI